MEMIIVRRGVVAVLICLLAIGALGCGSLGFADAVPGLSGLPRGEDPLETQSRACTEAMQGAVASQGLTDSDDVNRLIEVIQSQNEGCGIPIWNPLASGDPGADECLRGLLRDQVTAGMMGVSGDGVLFLSMQASDGTPTGEGCFMYHAKRGTWVASGLDHARRYMEANRCRRAPGAMIPALDPTCVAMYGHPDQRATPAASPHGLLGDLPGVTIDGPSPVNRDVPQPRGASR